MNSPSLSQELSQVQTPTKEHPVLFSGEMVRAILEGRKTQTRRVAKFVPYHEGFNLQASSLSVGDYCTGNPEHGKVLYSMGGASWQQRTKPLHCPYGEPGDRLWVRETFWAWRGYASAPNIFKKPRNPDMQPYFCYDEELDGGDETRLCDRVPSIYMPRWASRLTLEILKVRVERVQGISEVDAIAEGVDAVSMVDFPRQATMSRRSDFAQLWNRINAKRGFGWDVNPWVWVIEFRRAA